MGYKYKKPIRLIYLFKKTLCVFAAFAWELTFGPFRK